MPPTASGYFDYTLTGSSLTIVLCDEGGPGRYRYNPVMHIKHTVAYTYKQGSINTRRQGAFARAQLLRANSLHLFVPGSHRGETS